MSPEDPIELEAEPIERAPGGRASTPRAGLAFAVAMAADCVQWVLMPLFFAGAVSPWNDALDVLVAVFLVRLLGWHWAFLPTFVVELVPLVDLVPTWTLAVWIATRGGAARRGSQPGSPAP
jgi:hypothetical protein